MYSLDQVIYFLEQRQQTEDWNIRDAAIAYLKGYREILPEYTQMKFDAVNDPLAWDELQEMKGKPVWVESKYYDNNWAIIRFIDDETMGAVSVTGSYPSEMRGYRDDYGKVWQAYRKERS